MAELLQRGCRIPVKEGLSGRRAGGAFFTGPVFPAVPGYGFQKVLPFCRIIVYNFPDISERTAALLYGLQGRTADLEERRKAMTYLPEEFLERMKEMLGEEYGEFLASYEEPRTYGLRVNRRKITPEEFEHLNLFPVRRIPWVENGFFYEGSVRPAQHPLYAAGLYYLQEPSAMTPAACLPVRPGERVLDLCAAPGGKATELGARLQGEGLLVANDISASRARALLYNLEVFGIDNAFVTNETPSALAGVFEGFFDKILVDAPCSGEGMFRKEEAVAKDWTPEKSEYFAGQQREIVCQAVKMLRPGGKLLYSTCTFAPCEDEQTISWVLEQFPEMHLIPLPRYEGFSGGCPRWGDGREELKLCVRIWPYRMHGEGHFLALLEKEGTAGEDSGNPPKVPQERSRLSDRRESGEGGRIKKKKTGKKAGRNSGMSGAVSGYGPGRKEREILEAFLEPCTRRIPMERLEQRGQKIYLVPELPDHVRGLKFLRNGLYMGEIRKDRFEPSQQLAMSLKAGEFREKVCLDPEDERVERYLRGETVEVLPEETESPSGWKLVCAGGYPLGWGKLVQGILKNKYQVSWRKS